MVGNAVEAEDLMQSRVMLELVAIQFQSIADMAE